MGIKEEVSLLFIFQFSGYTTSVEKIGNSGISEDKY